MEGVYNNPKKLDISGEGDRNSYDIIYGRSHQGPAGEGRLQNYIAFFSPKKIPWLRPYRKNLSCKKKYDMASGHVLFTHCIALQYSHSSRNNIIETEIRVRLVLDVNFLTCK